MRMALDFFDELEREMWNLSRRSLVPLTSISETEDKIIVEVDLPLVEKKNIKLRVVEGGLEVEASLTKCVSFENWGTVQRNCQFESFYTFIALPSSVVAESATATFKKGILKVELKKSKKFDYTIPIE